MRLAARRLAVVEVVYGEAFSKAVYTGVRENPNSKSIE